MKMSYWKDRVEKQKEILLGKSIEETENHLARLYRGSMRKVESEMKELYYELLQDSMDGTVSINDLYRYNRYWEIRSDINRRLTDLGQAQIVLMDKDLTNMYLKVNRYFNENPKFLAKTSRGIIKEVSTIPVDINSPIVSEKAQAVVNALWCADGRHWSERVWSNLQLLQSSLEEGLVDTITRGIDPIQTAHRIAQEQLGPYESFNQAFARSKRLVRTELSHIYNEAAVERYKEAGCEGYE